MRYVLAAAVAICMVRAFVEPTHVSVSGSYQAVAHLFVGGLIGWAVAERRWRFGIVAGVMSVVEVAAAVLTRVL